uniref:Uncharacterized protein n=1 Tax=Zea mays TaxID=4577 RepID=A0A804M1B9_MAIZE
MVTRDEDSGHPRKEEYFASDDVCLEDGILAIVKQGDERPLELLAKAYAIKSFDIDPQNPSDVVFTLEWESIGVLPCGEMARRKIIFTTKGS